MAMEKISATNNSTKVDDAFSSDLGIKDESEETVWLEQPELRKRYEGSQPRRRQIHRRPLQLQRSVYDPAIVSLGPYHHGRPELHAAEEVKYRFLDRLTSCNFSKKNFLYDKVLEKIDEYDDKALALMILLDASFTVAIVEGLAGDDGIFVDWHRCLGMAALWLAVRDIMVLENQIPFQVIKMIISLQRGCHQGEELLHKFLNWLMSGDFSFDRSCCIPVADDKDPPFLSGSQQFGSQQLRQITIVVSHY